MRFVKDGPSIPDQLLDARDTGQVVFLCGAGVSIPAGMPTFIGLAQHVIDQLSPPASSNAVIAFAPWRDGTNGPKRPLDEVFNFLVQEFGREPVVKLVTERLMSPTTTSEPSPHHDVIARLSADQAGVPGSSRPTLTIFSIVPHWGVEGATTNHAHSLFSASARHFRGSHTFMGGSLNSRVATTIWC